MVLHLVHQNLQGNAIYSNASVSNILIGSHELTMNHKCVSLEGLVSLCWKEIKFTNPGISESQQF